MPVITAPNIIEQSDFSGGYAPDPDKTAVEPNILLDVSNLLPDSGGSDALVTRAGFKRIREELGATTSHYIRHIFPFRGNSRSYLICVTTNELAAADNVRIFAIDMSDLTVARIDTAGRTWANSKRDHWGMGIQEIFYGGSPGNDVYSWNPVGSVWNATAHTKTRDTLVDNISPGAGEVARDFAFKDNKQVLFNSKVFTPANGIRYEDWEDGQRYIVGERVSRKTAIGGFTYYRSYRCISAHTAVLANNAPGTGTNQADRWKKVRLPLPQNVDSETSDKWYFVPVATGSSVAAWHGDRFWIRYDGQGDKSRVLYSAPVEPEKGADVADVVFDMTDFSPGNDIRGPGGGWVMFNDGRKEGVVEAMHSMWQYLLVFKRQATWVLTGRAEPFTIRRLSRHIGAVGPECVVELNSLVYILSDDGLYVTDGTAIEPVRGNDKVKDYIAARIDTMSAEGAAGDVHNPMMWEWDNMLWFSLPNETGTDKHITMIYDPRRAAFYRTNLPMLARAKARHLGIPHMYFAAPLDFSTRDLVYEYNHADVVAAPTDDTGVDVYANQAIPWHMRTTWWPFGLLREQRRIRRVWAVVKGALTYTIKSFRDWSDTEASSEARVVTGANPVHIEGEVIPDSHAISMRLSGASAPATIYGIAVETQPRRARYHTG